jgi:hypothetical protein
VVIRIPLSLVGDPDTFKREVEAHCVDLVAHRRGKPGVPAPVHEALIDSLILRVPRGDPLPDDFQVIPYEIFDDGPTLDERKAALAGQLRIAQAATVNAILSPARAALLNLDMTEALSTPEEMRTPGQLGAIAAYVAFQSRVAEINRSAAVAALEIEELTAEKVETWKVPEL